VRLIVDKAEEEFRDEVRTWLVENAPRDVPPPHGPQRREFDMAWQYSQYKAGYAGVGWPAQYGGSGFDLVHQLIWFEEYARSGAPDIGCGFVGLNHAGPTLIAKGSEEQRLEYLPRILKGESVWCQGFSEPGAGSDLAGLVTKGVVDGDHLVVTGQKIWSSFADVADVQELLVRTDPTSTRHHGLTWVICDMTSPGIEIRPIWTMAGTPEFCEIFYDQVRVPLTNVVGGVGAGWATAMSTLSFERGTGFVREQIDLISQIDELVAAAHETTDAKGRRLIRDDRVAFALAGLRAQASAMYAMTLGIICRARGGAPPGADGSMVRVQYSELRQRFESVRSTVLGIDGLILAGGDPDPSSAASYLDSFKVTIGAGTKDVQRNIIGERLLGLPKS
jgi:alkylation response protein AidB-like acyl-CoA dehydrogenase